MWVCHDGSVKTLRDGQHRNKPGEPVSGYDDWMIEMVGPVLTRALQPFPVPVRTLDAIHLAALEFIRAQKQSVQLASYDERLLAAARFLGIAEWSESQ